MRGNGDPYRRGMRTETLSAAGSRSAPVIEQVMHRFGVAEEPFTKLEDHGVAAATWISASWVLQRRPLAQRGRIALARRLAAEHPGHPALEGCRYHALTLLEPPVPGCEPDVFWTLQERIQGHCPSGETAVTGTRLLELAARMAPEAVRQLRELSMLPVPRAAWMTQPTRSTALQGATGAIVLAHAKGLDQHAGELIEHRLGREPESEIVLAHGDPILKNQVLRDGDAPLIDWETIGPLPRHADLTHIASYLCRCLDPGEWEQASDLVGESAAAQLSWDARTWRRAVMWQILRDLVAYPAGRERLGALARLAAKR